LAIRSVRPAGSKPQRATWVRRRVALTGRKADARRVTSRISPGLGRGSLLRRHGRPARLRERRSVGSVAGRIRRATTYCESRGCLAPMVGSPRGTNQTTFTSIDPVFFRCGPCAPSQSLGIAANPYRMREYTTVADVPRESGPAPAARDAAPSRRQTTRDRPKRIVELCTTSEARPCARTPPACR
jgi:hypothetical protein